MNFVKIIWLSILCCTEAWASGTSDSLLKELDKAIVSYEQYDWEKEHRIADIKAQLNQTPLGSKLHFQRLKEVYREYEAYICDSARFYSQRSLSLAIQEADPFWTNESRLQLAHTFAGSGMYPEAIGMLREVDIASLSDKQKATYYIIYADTYIYWGEYSGEEAGDYFRIKNEYQDSALTVLSPQDFDYKILTGRKYIESGEFAKAEKALVPYEAELDKDTRQYAIYASLLAYLYEQTENKERQQEYLAESAMADIKASVKENTSLRYLAAIVLNHGETERANRYIKKSLEDANFYNARLRNIQTSQMLPVIDKAYQLEREQQRAQLKRLLIIVSVLTALLLVFVIYIVYQMRKLANARRELSRANELLKESNASLGDSDQIKEEYIGQFLSLCSVYIEKLEGYRRTLNKQANSGKFEELVRTVKSTEIVDEVLKDFYQHFDVAFLHIFPHFVERFNALLPEDDRIVPKRKESLTTELRIFALIRLGITDSNKIASFLRYSITTIYNYRSRYRNRAIVPSDKFEDEIAKIDRFTL